jgi:hypothetical protein
VTSDSNDAERAKHVSRSEISENGPTAHAGASPAPPVAGGGPTGPSAIPTPSGGVTRPAQPPPGFGQGVNDYLNHYVTVADAKAGAILAANLAVGAALLDNQPAVDPLFRYRAALAMLGISSLICMVVVFPRLPSGGEGSIFWEDIRKRGSLAVYGSKVRSLNEEDVEREYASQNWFVSSLLHRKFRYVQWAIVTFALGVALSGWWALGS